MSKGKTGPVMVGVRKYMLNSSDNHNTLLTFNNSGISIELGSYPIETTIFLYNGNIEGLYA